MTSYKSCINSYKKIIVISVAVKNLILDRSYILVNQHLSKVYSKASRSSAERTITFKASILIVRAQSAS